MKIRHQLITIYPSILGLNILHSLKIDVFVLVGGPRLHDIFVLKIASCLESTDEIIRKYKKATYQPGNSTWIYYIMHLDMNISWQFMFCNWRRRLCRPHFLAILCLNMFIISMKRHFVWLYIVLDTFSNEESARFLKRGNHLYNVHISSFF